MSEQPEQPIWTSTYTLELRDLVRYAGASGDLNPIHYDRDFARSRGLPDVIAHGAFSLGTIARLIRQHAPGRVDLRRLEARFVGVVTPGVEVTVTCYEVELDDDGTQELRVDLRHTAAERPSITAEATVAPRPTS